MTVTNYASDGQYPLLIALFRAIAHQGPMGKDELIRVCTVADSKHVRATISTWIALGLFVEQGDDSVAIEPGFGKKRGETLDELTARLPAICRRLLFDASHALPMWRPDGKLTDEGIGGLRTLDKQYQDLLAKGGLTPELKRQFDVARGYLSDQYTRSGRALGAALAQRRAQSGGALTPGAVAEMEKQGGATRDEQYSDASNELNISEAQMGYESTKDLYTRIENIRGTITSTGLTREQQGLLAQLHAASLMLDRRKAITNVAGSIFGGMGGI